MNLLGSCEYDKKPDMGHSNFLKNLPLMLETLKLVQFNFSGFFDHLTQNPTYLTSLHHLTFRDCIYTWIEGEKEAFKKARMEDPNARAKLRVAIERSEED